MAWPLPAIWVSGCAVVSMTIVFYFGRSLVLKTFGCLLASAWHFRLFRKYEFYWGWGMRKYWLYINGACRMVSFQENLSKCFSEYWFTPELGLEMERTDLHVSFLNIQNKFQGLQLKANVSLAHPSSPKQRETMTFCPLSPDTSQDPKPTSSQIFIWAWALKVLVKKQIMNLRLFVPFEKEGVAPKMNVCSLILTNGFS